MTPPTLRRVLGGLLGIAVVALLILWIGPSTIARFRADLLYYTGQHLLLVACSMVAALITGLGAGIALSRPSVSKSAERFMQIFNVANTVPPMAVLAIALAFFGIGGTSAVFALWLAALLPIVRNTYQGLAGVDGALKEAARGLGMRPLQSLWQVELPNAWPVIMGGVRIALVINVGSAPLSFLIGANSLGNLIFPGIYLNDPSQMLLGAVATALLALVLDGLAAWLTLRLSRHQAPSERAVV
ncbi:ABC transporter permease [Halotalea alkalilenta]|uniref:ABC transporter permease n=1 Tax=Halotalea alkalilenta TaxID=376489 RepID=UPI0004833392|nr:ABC transporter permease [Halotalea alkalilenta]